MVTFSRKDEILDHAHSYHEAAHAVFAVKVCGGKVSYVKTDDERGECSSSSPAGGGYANHMRNAMRSLAGQIAHEPTDRRAHRTSRQNRACRVGDGTGDNRMGRRRAVRLL
jgi:hypothetical protein